ncbi:MAG TPA: outer membrane beta-barrel protein [Gammaproteobacteria bacterium]
MKKSAIAAAVAALALPAAAIGADSSMSFDDSNLSYTYAEFGYTDRDFDGPSADGFDLNASYEVTDLIFVFGGYTDLSGDGDSSTLELGAGAAIGFTDKLDGYAKLAYLSNDAGVVDDTGFGLEFGVRSMVAKNIEVFGDLQYVDIYNDTDTAFEIGGRYWHQSNLGFSLAYIDGDLTGSGITLAARYNF